MDIPIKYVTTSDGVRIAYTVRGSGPVMVSMAPGLGHSIEHESRIPSLERTAAMTARAFTYVRFDHRGSGLSDRDATDFSLDRCVLDLEAVMDAVAPQQAILVAVAQSVAMALLYAARHPERVSRLASWMGFTYGKHRVTPALTALNAIATTDFRLFTEAQWIARGGNMDRTEMALWAEMFRKSVSPETYLAWDAQTQEWDVRDVLGEVRCPVLVIQAREHLYFRSDQGRELVAGLRDATLVLTDGDSVIFSDDAAAAMARFVAPELSGAPRAATPREDSRSAMAVLLFTDIVDSTSLTERLGDAAFRERATALDAAMRDAIIRSGGRAVDGKLLGDGVLAVFRSAREAIAAAHACVDAAARQGLQLHAGLHAGDVIREGDNVYGGAVNIDARVASASAPDEVLVSETVRALARTSAGVTFTDRGEHTLKGIDEPHRLYAALRT